MYEPPAMQLELEKKLTFRCRRGDLLLLGVLSLEAHLASRRNDKMMLSFFVAAAPFLVCSLLLLSIRSDIVLDDCDFRFLSFPADVGHFHFVEFSLLNWKYAVTRPRGCGKFHLISYLLAFDI